MKNLILTLLAFLAVAGCSRQQIPRQASQQTRTEPEKKPPIALVAYDGIGVRKQPGDDKMLKGNVFTSVDRGEKVIVLGDSAGWTRVKLSDDKEGWIRTDHLRIGVAKLAVLTEEVQVLARPDLSSRTLILDSVSGRLGSLVWIYKDKDGFYECEFPGNKRGWVRVGLLCEDPKEIEAAQLLEQARKHVKRNQVEIANGFYQQIVDRLSTTRVAQLVPLESDVEPKPQGE